MTNDNETRRAAERPQGGTAKPEVRFHICLDGFRPLFAVYGLLMLLIVPFLTGGLLFVERPESAAFPSRLLEGAGCGLFLAASWCLTATGLLMASRGRRLRQMNGWCRTLACISLLLCILSFALRDNLDPGAPKPSPFREGAPIPLWGAFTMGALVLSLMMWKPGHLRRSAKSSESSPGSPLLRPLRAVLNVPVVGKIVGTVLYLSSLAIGLLFLGIIFRGATVGIFYLVERVGTCFVDQELGVGCVFVFVLIALPVLVLGNPDLMRQRMRP
jgi:hypothetical protein